MLVNKAGSEMRVFQDLLTLLNSTIVFTSSLNKISATSSSGMKFGNNGSVD